MLFRVAENESASPARADDPSSTEAAPSRLAVVLFIAVISSQIADEGNVTFP
jgi:hypothetical protein